jgi:hypothetical protein
VSGSAAITINANPGDKINIVGVVLDGTAITDTVGIQYTGGGILIVQDSVIRNFSHAGINFVPISSILSKLFVSNTLLSDNGGNGITIEPSGSGTTNGVLDHVRMVDNASNGLEAETDTQAINVTVTDSVSAGNGSRGIIAMTTTMSPISIMVRNSAIANNGNAGLEASGTGTTVRVTRSTIVGNNTGWVVGSSGAVSSYGDNDIFGNVGNNNAPPSVSHE